MYDLLCDYFGSDVVNLCCFLLLLAPFAVWRIAVALHGNGVTGFRRRLRRRWLSIGAGAGLLLGVFLGYAA